MMIIVAVATKQSVQSVRHQQHLDAATAESVGLSATRAINWRRLATMMMTRVQKKRMLTVYFSFFRPFALRSCCSTCCWFFLLLYNCMIVFKRLYRNFIILICYRDPSNLFKGVLCCTVSSVFLQYSKYVDWLFTFLTSV